MSYAHEGAIRRRHLQQQTDQAWCLTLATNAITAWTSEYLAWPRNSYRSRAAKSSQVNQTLLAHLSPAQPESIGLIGTITVDIDAELTQLDPTGHRLLRPLATVRPRG